MDDKRKNREFDDDEKLRQENEILKLRLQAETGAYFSEHSNMPPEIENQFLKNVLAFEKEHGNAKPVKVYELIGKPKYRKAEELNEEEMEYEYDKLNQLMNDKNIALDFLAEYDIETMYRFLTEELFEHETTLFGGMTTHFTYEEFHPNHRMDLEEDTMKFLQHWFEQSFDEFSSELGNQFILADRRILKKEEVLQKFEMVFAAFKQFKECQYHIHSIDFDLKNDDEGMANTEGAVRYEAITEDDEIVPIEGPFKIYFHREYGYWSIFYFIFPGFEW